MAGRELEVPFKCGRKVTEWRAFLGRLEPKWAFLRFERGDATVSTSNANQEEYILRKLQELTSARAAISPPASAELMEVRHVHTLARDEITDFGFACPACADNRLLICPYETCGRIACQGSRDESNRVLCRWCGGTVVFQSVSIDRNSAPRRARSIEVEATRVEAWDRQLPRR